MQSRRRTSSSFPVKHAQAVFIGRFQPPHLGHLKVIEKALERARRLMILVGSSNTAMTSLNPFDFNSRKAMIEEMLDYHKIDKSRVSIKPLNDYEYNDTAWITAVQEAVNIEYEGTDVVLVGHSKDSTSYYLKMFPQWSSVEVENFGDISSTPIRREMFTNPTEFFSKNELVVHDEHHGMRDYRTLLSPPVYRMLHDAYTSPDTYYKIFLPMTHEYLQIEEYPKRWGKGPHVTVDSVVVQSGHVLLVRRGHSPGKGLLALPGGFLDVDKQETLLEGAIRETLEETRLTIGDNKEDVVRRILRGSMKHQETFDTPRRDPRARIITTAFLFQLEPRHTLPSVVGSDDAADARWYQIADLDPAEFFSDHYHIIQRMLGYLDKNI